MRFGIKIMFHIRNETFNIIVAIIRMYGNNPTYLVSYCEHEDVRTYNEFIYVMLFSQKSIRCQQLMVMILNIMH
jgi:hypothetical protein